MVMDVIKSHLEILSANMQKETNYVSWRFKVDLTLKSKGLFAVATGLELKEGSNTEVEQWIKKDLDAQAIIGLNVDSKIAHTIVNCTSAKQMLDKLCLLYGKKSDLSIEGLQRRFFSFTFDSSKSAVENCMKIQQLAEDLQAEGEEIKESWVLTRILGLLPPKLHHFRTAWDNIDVSEKKFNLLIERLRLEEDRLNESDSIHNVFISRQTKNSHTGKSNPRQ